MRKFKQLVAMLVCIATIASLLTFSITSVSAEESLPQVTITEADLLLIEKMEALGVITNDYSASEYVTRRQMAEIVKTYMGLPEGAVGSGDKRFNDVTFDDPSYGAISTLRDLEVISGDENNNFNPDNYLNYNEAVVFIINAVGHKYFAQREGGFPTGYMRVAIKHNMLKNLNMTNGTDHVTVIDVYKMLEAALDAATIIPQYYGDGSVRYTISETDTFLSETYGIYKYRGQVTGNEFTNLTSAALEITDEQIEIDGVIYDTPGYVYGYFLGYTVDYYVKHSSTDGDLLVYVEETPKKNTTIQIDSEDILTSKVTSDRIYYEDENEEEEHIDIDVAVDVIYNNQCYTGFGVISNIMPANGYIKALDNNNDGVYEVLFIYDYTIAVVDSVDTYDEEIVDRLTNSVLDLTTNVRRVDVISAQHQVAIPFDNIKKGDILNIATGRGTEKIITIYVNSDKVTGKITSYTSNLGYEIDGEYYEATYNYADETLAVGLSGAFYLDMSGKIAAYEYAETGVTAMTAAMAGVDYNEKSTMNPNVQLKLFTNSGVFITAPLADNVKVNNRRYDMTDMEEVDTVLDILCDTYDDEKGKYSLNDSYVIKYTLATDGSISYIDTGAIGGPGNLNPFADHYLFSANRIGIAILGATKDNDWMYAPIAKGALIFKVPAAGNLMDETGYAILETWKGDFSYASSANINNNFGSSNTEVIENYTAYHTDSNDINAVEILMLRGASAAKAVGNDSKMYVVTEITTSVDADGNNTRTLYEGNEKIGQLAQSISVTKSGASTIYNIDQLIAADILANGTVARFGTNIDGYIDQVSVVSDYNATTGVVTPRFDADGNYVSTTGLYADSKAHFAVAEINTYDKKLNVVDVTCGTLNYVFDMTYAENIKIYDSDTGKIRKALASEIRDGDKCVLRIRTFFRLYDVIIMR